MIGRSHDYALQQLARDLGGEQLPALNSDRIIEYARSRKCKPQTWAAELSYLGQVLRIARAVWRLPVVGDPVGDARTALTMLGYRLKGRERDRRPSAEELARLTAHFDKKKRQRIPMGKIMQFAIATTMRAEEITRLQWVDLDEADRTIVVRDRKDPQDKEGNDQVVPLLGHAWTIVQSMDRSLHLPVQQQVVFQHFSPSLPSRRAAN